MKLLACIFSLFIFLGCSNTIKYNTVITFDNKNGYVESLKLNTWESGQEYCFGIGMVAGHRGDYWLPAVSLIFDNKIQSDLFIIQLSSPKKGDFKLLFKKSTDGKDFVKPQTLKEGLSYGDIIQMEIYVEDRYLHIKESGGEENRMDIGFVPESLSVSSSSASSIVGFTAGKCI